MRTWAQKVWVRCSTWIVCWRLPLIEEIDVNCLFVQQTYENLRPMGVLCVLDCSCDLKPLTGKTESCWRAYNSESGKVDSCVKWPEHQIVIKQWIKKHIKTHIPIKIYQDLIKSYQVEYLDIEITGAWEQKTSACSQHVHIQGMACIGMCTNGLPVFVFEHRQPDQVLEYVEVS